MRVVSRSSSSCLLTRACAISPIQASWNTSNASPRPQPCFAYCPYPELQCLPVQGMPQPRSLCNILQPEVCAIYIFCSGKTSLTLTLTLSHILQSPDLLLCYVRLPVQCSLIVHGIPLGCVPQQSQCPAAPLCVSLPPRPFGGFTQSKLRL